MPTVQEKIERLQGPIMVLGASGFIGANLSRSLHKYRSDVDSVTSGWPRWRLEGIDDENIIFADLNDKEDIDQLASLGKPKTVFDCAAYGSYPFQNDGARIALTNVGRKVYLVGSLIRNGMTCYIHAGSSSEYGTNSAAPLESDRCYPNSDYASSKLVWSQFMRDMKDVRCANLRLYSVYGPYEDGSRLIPQVIQHGMRGGYPPFVRPDITRDFVYVDDVVEVFLDAANNLKPEDYGGSFNIGTGKKTRIDNVAYLARGGFDIEDYPTFSMPSREWDHANDWYANPTKAKERLGWSYRTSLVDGLAKTVEWYKSRGEAWEWPTIAPTSAG